MSLNAYDGEASPPDHAGDLKPDAKETTTENNVPLTTEKTDIMECEQTADTDDPQQKPENAETQNNNQENENTETVKETVQFKVIYNKKKYDVTFPLDDTVSSLRKHLQELTGVPEAMQKLMFKGKMRDDETLRQHELKPNTKVMLVGSTVQDVMSVSKPDPKELRLDAKAEPVAASKEPLSKQKPHKTALEKHGKPDDALPGIKGTKQPLPPVPLSGMYNKAGGKVRLTFKLEQDQLWIGTKERTDKIPLGSIKAVVSEPIDGHEEYHLMGIQLGPTEASRYWVYWVPAQYVDAIKDSVLGKWQFF